MVVGLLLPMVTTVTTLCPGVCDVQGKAKRRHLSADECQHLGHGSLTEPHVFNQRPGNSDRHRRHLPRTAPKKHKCGNVYSQTTVRLQSDDSQIPSL